MVAGMLVGLAGVVLLIVGIVRRSRYKRAMMNPYGGYPQAGAYQAGTPVAADPQAGTAGTPEAAVPQPGGLPAAGWYPDPQIPGTQRWWDGTRWTDQTQNS
jgi:hypothetical protein